MFDSFQETVDRLALSLQRSIAVDDASFGLLVCSAHFGDLDEARLASLTSRQAAGVQLEYLKSRRLSAALEPVTLPAYEEAGFAYDRLCVPLRSRYEVLGYLWVPLITPLSPDEHSIVLDAADTLKHLLYNTSQSIDTVNMEIESETLALLADEEAVRQQAARELRDLGMFNRSKYFVAACFSLPIEWAPWGSPPPRDLIFRVVWRAVSAPAIDSYSFVVSTPDTFIVVGYQHEPPPEPLEAMGRAIIRELGALDTVGAEAAGVGIGSAVGDLSDVWKSYEQATLALRTGHASGESVALWSADPVLASIVTLLAEPTQEHARPATLRTLDTGSTETVELLRAFLRNNGNVAETADELNIHRATVYYRLRRFAETTGLDIDDSDARFVIHAWLQQRRIQLRQSVV